MPLISHLLSISKALWKHTPTHDPLSPKEVNEQLHAELLWTKETDVVTPLQVLDMLGDDQFGEQLYMCEQHTHDLDRS